MFPQRTWKDCFEQSLFREYKRKSLYFCDKIIRYIIPNIKCSISCHKYIIQNEKDTSTPYQSRNTPTKTPSMSSQLKEYANKTPKTPSQSKNTPKHHHSSSSSDVLEINMWISFPNINLHCFVARQFLLQIYALFGRTIFRPKNAVAYKKWQI